MAARPFRIAIEQRILDDLQRRLARTRLLPQPAEDWRSGTSTTYLRELVDTWREGYRWRVHEERLNQLPHFQASLGDVELHFVHTDNGGTPLLLLHGWPDCFYRYHKVIEPLAAAGFELIVPSLPGFPLTGPVTLPGKQPMRHVAGLLHALVTEVLGHRRYLVSGGDGGSVLAQLLALDHPTQVMGIHLTDLGWHASQRDTAELSREEKAYLERSKKAFMADGAYAMLQTTRPASLAPALADSPLALAAWIVDRFHSWADAPDHLEKSFSKDDLLTNLTLYWASECIASSMASYLGEARSPSLSVADRVEVPVSLCLFPRDIGGIPPRRLAERTLNVQRWSEQPRGGHFGALEEPGLFAQDLIAAYSSRGF